MCSERTSYLPPAARYATWRWLRHYYSGSNFFPPPMLTTSLYPTMPLVEQPLLQAGMLCYRP